MSRFLNVLVFFGAVSVLYGQNSPDFLPQLDATVKTLGAEVNKRLIAEQARQVGIGQWTYRDTVPPLGDYWQAQLLEELINTTGRSYQIVSGPQAGVEWTLAGEIIEVGGTIRVYTRFLRAGNSIAAILHSDFQRDEYFIDLLGIPSSGDSYSPAARDAYEPDSRDNAVSVTIGAGEDAPYINRTLHNENDEDFFLLAPDRDGTLTMETRGDIDTVMELYEAGSRNQITEDDDGGDGNNARIRQTVRAGARYVVKVRGYGSTTGTYGFHAYLLEQVQLGPDEFEDDNEFNAARDISVGTPQEHTFHSGGDVDWVKFRVSRGRYTIRTRGVRSTRLDTYIELYDSDYNSIDEDDDGGDDLDSRLSVQLQAGTYYLKVECLNDEPDQPYTIRVDAE
ncbi:MAG: hypothetical protein LBF95_06265 [Treponema sp.]|jgi:hypothetical protein|nr:hypothetical protein [Treponema sp.]